MAKAKKRRKPRQMFQGPHGLMTRAEWLDDIERRYQSYPDVQALLRLCRDLISSRKKES